MLIDAIKVFKEHDIYVPPPTKVGDHTFNVHGPNDSVVIYRLRSPQYNTVDAWFGKYSDDSGGLGLQGSVNGFDQLLEIFQLHKRFLATGHLQVLRDFEDERRNRHHHGA